MSIDAAVDVLRADLTIADGRIFGTELPKSEAAQMPRQAVVVSPAGGPEDVTVQQMTTDRLDFICFGATVTDAHQVSVAVHRRLKFFGGGMFASRKVHNFTRSSGRSFFRDPDTDWPVYVETWLIRVADIAIAILRSPFTSGFSRGFRGRISRA